MCRGARVTSTNELELKETVWMTTNKSLWWTWSRARLNSVDIQYIYGGQRPSFGGAYFDKHFYLLQTLWNGLLQCHGQGHMTYCPSSGLCAAKVGVLPIRCCCCLTCKQIPFYRSGQNTTQFVLCDHCQTLRSGKLRCSPTSVIYNMTCMLYDGFHI